MTPDELWDAFRSFTHEAVRVETLQHYVVPGDEDRQQAFHDGRPLPQRPAKQASVELIAEAVRAGKRIWRIHLVEMPLSDYVRYELAAYAENVAAGEGVWIADRATHPELNDLRHDFVIFDQGTDHASVIWYDYDPDGRLRGWRRGTSDDIAICTHQLESARRHAVPLADFLTSCEGTR